MSFGKTKEECRRLAENHVTYVKGYVGPVIRCITDLNDMVFAEYLLLTLFSYLARERLEPEARLYLPETILKISMFGNEYAFDRKKELEAGVLRFHVMESEEEKVRNRKGNPLTVITDLMFWDESLFVNPGEVQRAVYRSVASFVKHAGLTAYLGYKIAAPCGQYPAAGRKTQHGAYITLGHVLYEGRTYAGRLAEGENVVDFYDVTDSPGGAYVEDALLCRSLNLLFSRKYPKYFKKK